MSTTKTPRNAGKPFTSAATSLLVREAGNISASSIAKRLGRTVKAVRRKAEKMNLSLSLN